MLSPLWARQQPASSQHDPILDQMTIIAQEFEGRTRLAGAAITSASPEVFVDTPPELSTYEGPTRSIPLGGRTCRRMRSLCSSASQPTRAIPTGKQFFEDMFHHFFFVHELAHWLQRQAKDPRDGYQFELDAKRVTVAYWRERDSAYLSTLLGQSQRLNERLPNPVPPGQDPQEYFDANKGKLGFNPDVYGWFQTRVVLQAGTERPILTFSEALHGLSAHANDPVLQ